jgi:prepilin-type N-terminal cleavage/methylation domain-containing protein
MQHPMISVHHTPSSTASADFSTNPNQTTTNPLRRNMKGNTKMNKTMFDRIQESKKKEGGFTLIELLIVIVILGILAGVVIFGSAAFKNKGAAEACKTNVSAIKTAVEAYHSESTTALYPTTWAQISGGATPFFDANGVTYDLTTTPPTVKGKGWDFGMTFDTLSTPAGSNPPGYANGVLTTAVPNSICRLQ